MGLGGGANPLENKLIEVCCCLLLFHAGVVLGCGIFPEG